MTAPSAVLFDAPGPKARLRHAVMALIGALAILALLGLVVRGLANPRNNQLTGALWSPFVHGGTWTDYLLPGLVSTLEAAALAILLSLVGGVALGIGRLSRLGAVRWACGVFVEFFRSVPVLVMMLFAYYLALYVLHLDRNQPFFGVVVGLFFYNASVIAELVRSGVGSLPHGQREAGLAVGLTEGQTMWSVLLPQAVTAMLPSLVSQLVVVLKDTALGYIIGYSDFVRAGQTMSNLYGNLIPTMIVMAGVYIVINYSLTRVAGGLEARLRRSGRGVRPAALVENPVETGSGTDSAVLAGRG